MPIKEPYWRQHVNVRYKAGEFGRNNLGHVYSEIERNEKNDEIAGEALEILLEAMGDSDIDVGNRNALLKTIYFLADNCRNTAARYNKLPRPFDIKKTLNNIAGKAQALNDALASIDHLSLKSLEDERFFGVQTLFENPASDQNGQLYGSGSTVTYILNHLEATALKAARRVDVRVGRRINWAAKELVWDCCNLWARKCPAKISSTEDGLFRTFILYMYELATGQEGVPLETDVKEHVKSYKEEERWRSSVAGIEAEISFLKRQKNELEYLLAGGHPLGVKYVDTTDCDPIILQEKIENLDDQINGLLEEIAPPDILSGDNLFPEITP